MTSNIVLRPFQWQDVPAITAIYGHYVRHTTVTFDTEPPSEHTIAAKYGQMVAAGHPVLIAARADKVLGFAYASTYRARPAYDFTCEDAIYLAPDATGKGIGTALLAKLIEEAQDFGFRQMLAVIEAGASPSIKLHEQLGFHTLGRFPALGYKFGRWLDIVHMQRAL